MEKVVQQGSSQIREDQNWINVILEKLLTVMHHFSFIPTFYTRFSHLEILRHFKTPLFTQKDQRAIKRLLQKSRVIFQAQGRKINHHCHCFYQLFSATNMKSTWDPIYSYTYHFLISYQSSWDSSLGLHLLHPVSTFNSFHFCHLRKTPSKTSFLMAI